MNRSKFSPSSRWRGLMMLVFLGILVGCYQSGPNEAQLVVTTILYSGNNDVFFEYRSGKTVATANMQYVYNPPTDCEAWLGDLSSIYQAITGKTPNDPSRIQTVESILQLMNQKGWKIVDDTSSGGGKKIVRTIQFQRRAK